MLQVKVPDMSCQHCVSSITEALKKQDAAVQVQADTESKLVQVHSDKLDLAQIQQALDEVGFSAEAA